MTVTGTRPIAPHRGDRVRIGRGDPQLIVAITDGRLTLQDDEGLATTVRRDDVYWDPLYRTWRLERDTMGWPVR